MCYMSECLSLCLCTPDFYCKCVLHLFPIGEKRRQSLTVSLNTDEAHPLLAAGVKEVNLAFAYLLFIS